MDRTKVNSRKLTRLRDLLSGQDVHVLGSGPDGSKTRRTERLMCANLSFTNPIIGGVRPDVVVMDIAVTTETGQAKPVWGNARDALQDLDARNLVLVQTTASKVNYLAIAHSTVDYTTVLYAREKNRVLRKATGLRSMGYLPSSMPSIGATAIAVAYVCGAQSIRLSGFGLTRPVGFTTSQHFYPVPGQPDDLVKFTDAATNVEPRSHSASDGLIVAAIAASGFRIESDNQFVRPLCTNWPQAQPWAVHPVWPLSRRPPLQRVLKVLAYEAFARWT